MSTCNKCQRPSNNCSCAPHCSPSPIQIISKDKSVKITKIGDNIFNLSVVLTGGGNAKINFADTRTVQFTGDGVVSPIRAAVRISPISGNILQVNEGGLFVLDDGETNLNAILPIKYEDGTISHVDSGVEAGTYNNVTVDSKGHVIEGTNVEYLSLIKAKIKRIQFRVGDPTKPVVGQGAFILRDCDNTPILNKKVDMYREGELQTHGDNEFGFTYNSTNGTVNVVPALYDRERIVFKVYDADIYAFCSDTV